MNERPKIKPELRTTDYIMEVVGWTSIIGIWVITLINYSSLPETIPIHFNGAGEADGFGGKATILTLPIVATILFISMSILNKYPQIFNYPTTITDENALAQYTGATRLIRSIKLIIVLIFAVISYKTIQTATNKADGLGLWFLPTILALIFIPMVYYVYKSFNAK